MGNLSASRQGVLNINCIQGNYLEVPLTFKNGSGDPIDLTEFVNIKMEVKKTFNVNETPFLTFTLGYGLTISGDNNNVLSFIIDEKFWDSQTTRWVYDIVFENAFVEFYTYITGTINVKLTASSL